MKIPLDLPQHRSDTRNIETGAQAPTTQEANMPFNLTSEFKVAQRPMDRAGFRYNAPKAIVAPTGWFATLLSMLGF